MRVSLGRGHWFFGDFACMSVAASLSLFHFTIFTLILCNLSNLIFWLFSCLYPMPQFFTYFNYSCFCPFLCIEQKLFFSYNEGLSERLTAALSSIFCVRSLAFSSADIF